MQIITLTKGFVAKVDDEDIMFLLQWSWHYCNGYAARNQYVNRHRKYIYMQNVISERMGLIGQIDHKDRNKLNNQRFNLRSSTRSLNGANAKISSRNSSGYKGVVWHDVMQKWWTRIVVDYQTIPLGYYSNIVDAALAYDQAAIRYFGEFAILNFPTLEHTT